MPAIRPPYLILSLTTALLFLAPAPALAAATAPPAARRYVALSAHAGPCPSVDGWTEAPLFNPRSRPPTRIDGSKPTRPPQKPSRAVPASGSPSRDSGAAIPTPLARYCNYTWDGKGASAEPLPTERDKFADKRKFVRADPDYDVLLLQGGLDNDPAVRLALNTAFRTMLGLRVIEQSIYEASDVSDIAKVAVIDTAPNSRDPLAVPAVYAQASTHIKHGLAMAEIINEVRCPARESACRRHLFFVDAFPWRGTVDGPQRAAVPGSSAHLGSLGSLAAAIFRAVDQWRAENAVRGTNNPLVLNLSLGWDTLWTPKEWSFAAWDIPTNSRDEELRPRGEWPATAQSVHAALVYASCFDVLVVAASGNNTAGGYDQLIGTAPGKWEQLLAPSRKTCVRLFGEKTLPAERSGPDIKVTRRPLVYAAGAQMSAVGGRLSIVRKDGLPPRMLAGAHVVAGRDNKGNALTEAWTGTSVAAAVLSGLAANVWTYDPRLSSHQVMALIDHPDNGKNTGTAAMLLGDNSGAESPHASTGAATSPIPVKVFEALCKSQSQCPKFPYVPSGSPDTPQAYFEVINYHGIAAAVAAACASWGCDTLSATVQLTAKPMNGNPTQRRIYYPKTDPDATPRTAGDATAEPWMRPQPETPICPVCPIMDKTLVLSINKALVPKLKESGQTQIELDNPLLEFRSVDGFSTVSLGKVTISIDKPTLIPLENYKINGAPLPLLSELGNGQSGTLTVFVTDSANRVVPLVSLVPVYK